MLGRREASKATLVDQASLRRPTYSGLNASELSFARMFCRVLRMLPHPATGNGLRMPRFPPVFAD